MEVKRLKKIYTLFISALPMISVYASGIPGSTLGDILLVFFFALRIIEGIQDKNFRIRKKVTPIISLIVAIPVISLISVLFQTNVDTHSIVIRIIRRLFYYLSIVIVSSEWFDFEYGKKKFVFWGVVGTLLLLVQYIAYFTAHRIIHGYLPFIPIYHESYLQFDYQQTYLYLFRPTSFLLEPAHISRYLMIPLVILLFADDSKWRWSLAFMLSVAILATTSGLGFFCLSIVWLLWIVFGTEGKGEKRPALYLLIYVAIVVTIVISINNKVVQGALLRITSSNLLNTKTAGGARFAGYVQFARLDFWGKIFGMGYGSTPDTTSVTWFSGASYMLYGTGLIGFFVCVVMFASLFLRNTSLFSRILIVVFLVLFFADDSFMSHVAVVFLSLITGSSLQNHAEEAQT